MHRSVASDHVVPKHVWSIHTEHDLWPFEGQGWHVGKEGEVCSTWCAQLRSGAGTQDDGRSAGNPVHTRVSVPSIFCASAGALGVLSIPLLMGGETGPRHLADTGSPLEALCQPGPLLSSSLVDMVSLSRHPVGGACPEGSENSWENHGLPGIFLNITDVCICFLITSSQACQASASLVSDLWG